LLALMPVRLAISFVPSSVSASASASRTLNARCTAPTSLNAGCPVRGIDSVVGDRIADKAPVSTISDLSSAAQHERRGGEGEREPEHEGREVRRQRDGQAGSSGADGGEREAPPADPVGERAEGRPEDTEQPEREDGAARGRAERERRPLEAVYDVREGADER